MKVILPKLKEIYKSHGHEVWAVYCVILAAYSGYNLGLSESSVGKDIRYGQNEAVIEAVNNEKTQTFTAGTTQTQIPAPTPKDTRVVASKASESKKYHYSRCSSWKTIKPENQLWFDTEAAAISAGFTLAGNCR